VKYEPNYHSNSPHSTSAATKTTNATSTTSPGPNNSMSLPTTAPPLHSRSSAQLVSPLNSTRYPPARPLSVMLPGIPPVAKTARSEPNSRSTNCERTYKNATMGQIRSLIPSAGPPTDQPMSNWSTHRRCPDLRDQTQPRLVTSRRQGKPM
jgi:hypothetical protein